MGQYNKAVLTAAGENLIARILAGEIQLNITKAKTSNYTYPSDTDFKALTDMQGVKQTVSDPVTAVYNDTMIQTRALFGNEEIESTYYIYNIGLYAMDGTEEVLICIVTAETPDEMPQYNGVASTSYIYNIQNVVQDAAELNITVNPSGTATIQDVLERVDATGGDISETVIETLDAVEDKYPVPTAGENVKRFFGKVLTFLRNIRPLTGDIYIYVSTTGSDSIGDGSELNPYATIQHAIDIIPKDLGGYTVTVVVSAGTYDQNLTIAGFGKSGNMILALSGNVVVRDVFISGVNMIVVSQTTNTYLFTMYSLTVIDSCTLNVWTTINITTTHQRLDTTITSTAYSIAAVRNSSIYASGTTTITGNTATGLNINVMSKAFFYTLSGSGLTEGIVIGTGSQLTYHFNNLSATTPFVQYSGGQIIMPNGTQISNLITSGLSCTWGTISGGYVRHGNQKGTAMVTVQMNIAITATLSPSIDYKITGFPIPSVVGMAVSVSAQSYCSNCYMGIGTSGEIHFWVTSQLNSGVGLAFSVTYLTNS